jgi:transposase
MVHARHGAAERNRGRLKLTLASDEVHLVSLSRFGSLARTLIERCELAIVRDDEVCRRLMTVPGVGPVVALTYRAAVDLPARFRNSKAVGAVFGRTPSRYQSGEINRPGAISKCGDEMMRVMLYEAAHIMLVRLAKWSWLKAWAMKIARHRGMKKAIVALARRLAVIMHRIWVDGTEFRWSREVTAA